MTPFSALSYLETAQENLSPKNPLVVLLYSEDQWPPLRAAATILGMTIVGGSLVNSQNQRILLRQQEETEMPDKSFALLISSIKVTQQVTTWRTTASQILLPPRV